MVNVEIKCRDGSFSIELDIVKKFSFLWENLNDDEGLIIDFEDISLNIMQKVLAYCEYALEFQKSNLSRPIISEDLRVNGASKFEVKLLKNCSLQDMMEIVEIAKEFGLIDLENLGCAKIACMIKGKSEEDLIDLLEQ
jgi:hypothetical protein